MQWTQTKKKMKISKVICSLATQVSQARWLGLAMMRLMQNATSALMRGRSSTTSPTLAWLRSVRMIRKRLNRQLLLKLTSHVAVSTFMSTQSCQKTLSLRKSRLRPRYSHPIVPRINHKRSSLLGHRGSLRNITNFQRSRTTQGSTRPSILLARYPKPR